MAAPVDPTTTTDTCNNPQEEQAESEQVDEAYSPVADSVFCQHSNSGNGTDGNNKDAHKSKAKQNKPDSQSSSCYSTDAVRGSAQVRSYEPDIMDTYDESFEEDVVISKQRNVAIQVCNVDEMTEDDFPDKDKDFAKTDADVAGIIKQINSIVLFQGYEEDELKSVINYMYMRKVTKGDVVIREGEEGDAFYVIRSGKYDCTVKAGRKVKSICTYDGSGYFGDLALVNHAPRAASITATTNGELWVLNATRYVWLKKRQAVRNAECFEQVIRQIPMFSKSLTNSHIGNLIDAIEVITMRKADIICRQGEPGDAMYFILDGKVSVMVQDQEVCIMSENSFFGERALVLDEGRAATCKAKTNVKLAKLPKESFEMLIPDAVVNNMRDYVAKTYSKAASEK